MLKNFASSTSISSLPIKLRDIFLDFAQTGLESLKSKHSALIKYFLLFSLLLVLFRIPIFAFFNIRHWARATLAFPFLAAFLSFFLGQGYKRISQISLFNKVFLLGGFGFGLIYILYLILVQNESFSEVLLPHLSSSIFFLSFPILLLNDKFLTKQDLDEIFNIIGMAVIFIGGGFFVFYRINFLINDIEFGFFFASPDIFRKFLIPDYLSNMLGSTYKYPSSRTIGYLVSLEHSAVGIVSFVSFFFIKGIRALVKRDFKQVLGYFFCSYFGAYAVLKSTSVWIFAIMFLVIMAFGFYILIIKRKDWVTCFISIGLIFLILNFSLAGTMTYERILYYFFNYKAFTHTWLPDLSGCYWENLLWNSNFENYSHSCQFGEWHFFSLVIRTGLFPMIGWLYFCLIPIFFMCRLNTLSWKDYPSLAFCLSMMISSLHYPSVFAWGNNFLYALGLLIFLPNGLLNGKISESGDLKIKKSPH